MSKKVRAAALSHQQLPTPALSTEGWRCHSRRGTRISVLAMNKPVKPPRWSTWLQQSTPQDHVRSHPTTDTTPTIPLQSYHREWPIRAYGNEDEPTSSFSIGPLNFPSFFSPQYTYLKISTVSIALNSHFSSISKPSDQFCSKEEHINSNLYIPSRMLSSLTVFLIFAEPKKPTTSGDVNARVFFHFFMDVTS